MKKTKKIFAIVLAVIMSISLLPEADASAASKKVRLNKAKAMVYVGKTVTLKLKNVKKQVKWSTSNKKVAIVTKKGKVKGKKAGKATITAKVGKKKYTCKITVKKRVTPKPMKDTVVKNKKDVRALKKIIKEQRKLGAEISEDINSNSYEWKQTKKNGEKRLVGIVWHAMNLKNEISFADLEKLTKLDCAVNNLKTLDISKNTELTNLYCQNNSLTTLDLSQNPKLKGIYCYNNRLATLDLSHNTELLFLRCYNNSLKTLDASKNPALVYLDCKGNELTDLNVSQNTKLETLVCSSNKLKTLDIRRAAKLKEIYCDDNELSDLDVSGNIEMDILICSWNRLTNLDVSRNTKLERLSCAYNNLIVLDLRNCPLVILDCDNINVIGH